MGVYGYKYGYPVTSEEAPSSWPPQENAILHHGKV